MESDVERVVRLLLEPGESAFTQLLNGIGSTPVPPTRDGLVEATWVFDANALLDLVFSPAKYTGVVDFLNSQHQGHLLVSFQTLVEVQNNLSSRIDASLHSVNDILGKALAQVNDIASIVPFPEKISEAQASLKAFRSDYGDVFDVTRAREQFSQISAVMSGHKRLLSGRCDIRLANELWEVRRAAKRPPGFEDSGSGDFVVWFEILLGLQNRPRESDDRLIFISRDFKKNWDSLGRVHPALVAEMKATTECELIKVSLAQLREQLKDDS